LDVNLLKYLDSSCYIRRSIINRRMERST